MFNVSKYATAKRAKMTDSEIIEYHKEASAWFKRHGWAHEAWVSKVIKKHLELVAEEIRGRGLEPAAG